MSGQSGSTKLVTLGIWWNWVTETQACCLQQVRKGEVMKLSNAMKQVIDLINDGWQLGSTMTMDGRTWLQKGGCGKGGDTKVVHSSTVFALIDRKLIEVDTERFPLMTYRLTEVKT